MTESNNLSFEVIEGWEQLPAGYAHQDVYVGEVTFTFGVSPGLVPADCHMFQKFRRVGSA